jgi:hypothetical protein
MGTIIIPTFFLNHLQRVNCCLLLLKKTGNKSIGAASAAYSAGVALDTLHHVISADFVGSSHVEGRLIMELLFQALRKTKTLAHSKTVLFFY